MTTRRYLVAAVFLAFVASASFLTEPATWIYGYLTLAGAEPPPPDTTIKLAPGVSWAGEYFAVEALDDATFAISEPRYWQRNVSYLIIGKKKAVLLDPGRGLHDIHPIVQKLTQLPVQVIFSHLHFDHISGTNPKDDVAMLDLPSLRAQIDDDGFFAVTSRQFLGVAEKVAPPRFKVKTWLSPNSLLDLGGRTIEILAAPGHTPDSLILLDRSRDQLFSGDFIYPGELFAFLPGANMGEYVATASRLVSAANTKTVVYPAHGTAKEAVWRTPRLAYEDLSVLHAGLVKICRRISPSTGFFPRRYYLNDRLAILTPFWWNMQWNDDSASCHDS